MEKRSAPARSGALRRTAAIVAAFGDLFVAGMRVHLTRASHELQLRRVARAVAVFATTRARSTDALPTPAR